MTLAKLKASAMRRGRGSTGDETRQLQDESVQRDELLRGAILELCDTIETGGASGAARIVAFQSHCNYSGSFASRYIPWGNVEEASPGAIDTEVVLMPPFGSNSIIVSLRVFCESDAGATAVGLHEFDGTPLATENIASMTADAMHTVTFDYTWDTNEVMLISIDPTTTPQSVSATLTIEEG